LLSLLINTYNQPLASRLSDCGYSRMGDLALHGNRAEVAALFIRLSNFHNAVLFFDRCNGLWCNKDPGPGSPKGFLKTLS